MENVYSKMKELAKIFFQLHQKQKNSWKYQKTCCFLKGRFRRNCYRKAERFIYI